MPLTFTVTLFLNLDVTILEMQPEILRDMVFQNKLVLLDIMMKKGVKTITNAKIKEITSDSVVYEDAEGKTVSIPAASVVSAFGYKAYTPLEDAATIP